MIDAVSNIWYGYFVMGAIFAILHSVGLLYVLNVERKNNRVTLFGIIKGAIVWFIMWPKVLSIITIMLKTK